jgi:PAS domain S-box-containing protein
MADGNTQLSSTNKALIERLDLQFALEAAELGVWELDPITNLVTWDDRCRKLFGLAKDNLLPYEQAISYIHPDDVKRVDEAVQLAFNPDSGGKYDVTYRTIGANDGVLRWVRFWGQSYFTADGQLTRFAGVAQDVTQQTMERQTLLRDEERLRTIFNHAPIGLGLLRGEDHTFELVNERIAELAGRRPEDLQGKPLLEALPELARQGLKEIFDSVRQTGQRFIAPEISIDLLRNGQLETAHFYANFEPVHEPDGSISIVDFSLEITQQITNQRALQTSEARFRSIVEQAPMALGLLRGREMTIEIGNQRVFEVWGKDESVTGMRLIDALPEIKEQGFIELLESVYDTGQPYEGIGVLAKLVRHGKLEDVYFDFVYTPLRENDQITGIMIMAVEVTPQVLARQAIEKSEARFRGLVHESPFAIAVYETSELLISVANEAMIKLWGKTPAVIGQKLADAVPELKGQPFIALLNTVYSMGTTYRTQEQEAKLVVDGHLQSFWFNFVYQPLFTEEGKVYGVLNMAVDVTEQVMSRLLLEQSEAQYRELAGALEERVDQRTQELTLANTDLKRSNDNLQQFAYVASHDLQEPLRKIQAFSSLLTERYAFSLGEEGTDLVRRMHQASFRMSALIKDLLAYSRISTRQQAFGNVSLNDIVANVLNTLEWQVEERQAQVVVDKLPVIKGDELQLGQLFQNLISNALKFTPLEEVPHVTIRCTYKQRNKLPANVHPISEAYRFCEISIVDNGIGFNTKYLDRIFQVFQRLHNRDAFPGTGVGLAICQRVVENHGGAITADSQPGEGSTFCVYLPV